MVTHEDTVLSEKLVDIDGSLHYTSEKADARAIRHVLQIAKCDDYKNIIVQTSDTDVFVLLLSVFPLIEEYCDAQIYCKYGSGTNTKYYHINDLAKSIGFDICRGLPFFHAFSGCDTTSSFYKHSEVAMWDAWLSYPARLELTHVF